MQNLYPNECPYCGSHALCVGDELADLGQPPTMNRDVLCRGCGREWASCREMDEIEYAAAWAAGGEN